MIYGTLSEEKIINAVQKALQIQQTENITVKKRPNQPQSSALIGSKISQTNFNTQQ